MHRIRTSAAAVITVLLGAVTGCTGQEEQAASPPPAATATVTASAPPADPSETAATGSSAAPPGAASDDPVAARPAPPTGTEEVAVERSPAEPPLVTGVRYAGHAGYDRVVIDLQGPMTGYTVTWVERLIQDGSGDPIPVRGGAYLNVALSPAAAHTESGDPTWEQEPVRRVDLTNVRSVVKVGDFEGVVSVGIVLNRKAGFRVVELSDPTRLVVDVAH